MTDQTRDNGRGADRLLDDLLLGEGPDPELLVRYASDPDALSTDEREALERQLAQSPALADELRVLRGFDPTASATQREPGARRSLWTRLQEGLSGGPVPAWAPIAVVTVMVAALALPLFFASTPPKTFGEVTVARAPEPELDAWSYDIRRCECSMVG